LIGTVWVRSPEARRETEDCPKTLDGRHGISNDMLMSSLRNSKSGTLLLNKRHVLTWILHKKEGKTLTVR